MRWYKVGSLADFHQPGIKKVNVGGRHLCLVNYKQEIFALGSKCPHAGYDLSRGWCSEGKLICPIHRFSYDLATGKGSPGQNDFVESYRVKIEKGNVYIGVETFWEKFKQVFR